MCPVTMASAREGHSIPEPGRPPRSRWMNILEDPMIARCLQWVAPILLAGFVLTGTASSADEKEIPKKVMDALRAKFPKAQIDKWTKEKEGDAVVYDIEFKE